MGVKYVAAQINLSAKG